MTPTVTEHDGIFVIRDDMLPGGTKARFLPALFEGESELVYASPPEGGAQTALAYCAQQLAKRATIFVAKRAEPHPRSLMAKALGAKVIQVTPGYLSTVRARAREYAEAHGARLLPFGVDCPDATPTIAAAARATGLEPSEIWCAAGSGVLARGLKAAWPHANLHVVQVGKEINGAAIGAFIVHKYPLGFSRVARETPPFPSDPHYDAKAWEICKRHRREGDAVKVFWNVTGPAN